MSFHGVPKRYLLTGDPYHCHSHKTARLLAERLGLSTDQWSVAFQSRFGREEWLRPYCDEMIARFPRDGITRLDVMCPGFSADCLETLEEVDMQYRQLFLDAGGQRFNYIPCLNDDREHLEFLAALIAERRVMPKDEIDSEQLESRFLRATAMGAEK